MAEIYTEAYFGKSQTLLKAENLLDDMIQKMKIDPGKDFTNSKENKLLSELLKKQFGFKDVIITWTQSIKDLPIAQTFTNIEIIFHGGSYASVDIKRGYYDKKHEHVCLINMSQSMPIQFNMTGAEMLAIILHEIGHNFDHSPYYIVSYLTYIINSTFNILKTYDPETGRIKYIAYLKRTGEIIQNALGTALGNTNIGHLIIGNFGKFFDYIYSEIPYLKEFVDKVMRILDNFTIPYHIYDRIIHLAVLPGRILYSPISHLYNTPTRKKEEYADSFAAAYGYASDLLRALSKMEQGVYYLKNPNGYDNFPTIVKFLADIAITSDLIINALLDTGHGIDTTRMNSTLKHLQDDLNRGSYSPEVKAELQTEIDKLNTLYKNYVNFGMKGYDLEMATITREYINKIFGGRTDYIAKLFPSYYAGYELDKKSYRKGDESNGS